MTTDSSNRRSHLSPPGNTPSKKMKVSTQPLDVRSDERPAENNDEEDEEEEE